MSDVIFDPDSLTNILFVRISIIEVEGIHGYTLSKRVETICLSILLDIYRMV